MSPGGTGSAWFASKSAPGTAHGTAYNDTNANVYADLTDVNAVTISSLIQAFAIQDLLQTDARGGTRYIEILNAHFGVTAPDYRLQRPEYLGGTTVPFIINPLAQTSETATTELGNLAATATATLNKAGFFKSFVEHGWVIDLLS